MAMTEQVPGLPTGGGWKRRLRAWWDGTEEQVAEVQAATPAAKPAAKKSRDEVPFRPSRWDRTRIEIIQQIFGPGMSVPGGAMGLQHLLAPFVAGAPNPVLLVIGAGLGGLAQAAGATGARVTAVEPDSGLASAANEVLPWVNRNTIVPIVHNHYDRMKIQLATLDGIIGQEALLFEPEPAKVLQQCRKLLKPGGKLVFDDFFRLCEPDNPSLLVWCSHESMAGVPLSVAELMKELADLGFEVEAQEDVGPVYRQSVQQAFAARVDQLKREKVEPVIYTGTIAEAEYWARRVALIDAGELSVLRVVARVPAN